MIQEKAGAKFSSSKLTAEGQTPLPIVDGKSTSLLPMHPPLSKWGK
jgi:hypothetical protein